MMTVLVRLLILLATLAALPGCAVNPVSGRPDFVLLTQEEEAELGEDADRGIRSHYGVYKDEALDAYLTEVGRRVARISHRPDLKYRFAVLDTADVNAFALPGGYVYVTRGMLTYLNNEAELAAALAHEIGHISARHSVRQHSTSAVTEMGATLTSMLVPGLGAIGTQGVLDVVGTAVVRGYGRDQELEADRLGAEYLARAGYDPEAMLRMLTILKNQQEFQEGHAGKRGNQGWTYHGLFNTHPDNDTRLKQVIAEAGRSAPAPGADRYLEHVQGVPFGPRERTGRLRGNDFYNSELNFGVRFPALWRIGGQTDKVQAQTPDGNAWIDLAGYQNVSGKPVDVLRAFLSWEGSVEGGLEVVEEPLNGLTAARARTARLQAAAVQIGSTTLLVVGAAKTAAAFEEHRDAIEGALGSIHALKGEEQRLGRSSLRLETVKPGDTYAALAERSGLGRIGEALLRLINNADPKAEPAAGSVIKTVD